MTDMDSTGLGHLCISILFDFVFKLLCDATPPLLRGQKVFVRLRQKLFSSPVDVSQKQRPQILSYLRSAFVDVASIDWHQVSLEYLAFSAIAKYFNHYLSEVGSAHYPLSGACNTVLYRDDVPDYVRKPTLV